MYFTIADLAQVDPMYQFSLQSFVELFCASIESSRDPKLKARKDRGVKTSLVRVACASLPRARRADRAGRRRATALRLSSSAIPWRPTATRAARCSSATSCSLRCSWPSG
jgi:hypothetical protein